MALVVALYKDKALLGVDAAGEQQGEGLARLLAALLRVDVDCQGMQVGDEVVAVVVLLHLLPAADCAEIVAKREDACRLDAGEDDFLAVVFHDEDSFLFLFYSSAQLSGISGKQKSLTVSLILPGTKFSRCHPVSWTSHALSGAQACSRQLTRA